MPDHDERDYVLGTNEEELQRLGLQNQIWRPIVLDCWQRAGIGVGSRVIDLGSGPGYAAMDLAEIVESSGEVVAIERSARFVQAGIAACQARGYNHVRFYELDLMDDPLPVSGFDAAWIRWVASFVSSPETLVAKLKMALRQGGVAIFHEYIDYAAWRLAPRSKNFEEFVQHVMESWRAMGGEPNVAQILPSLLLQHGFQILSITPHVFCCRPQDNMWRWPSSFIDSNVTRLLELGRVTEEWADSVRQDLAIAESNPNTIMITPMVLEIIAERCSGED